MTGAARTVRFSGLPRSRWANGLGETVELLAHAGRRPVRRATEHRDDRLGRALLVAARGGPRPAVPLATPLTLDLDGRRAVLDRFDAVSFAGEADVRAVGVTAPGYDLNLMVRRGTGRPTLAVASVDGEHELHGVGVVLDGTVTGPDGTLAPFDAVIALDGTVTLTGQGRVAVVVPAAAGTPVG
ncbi:HutD family protein [Curtobacterium flaccumfaciens]|nr:HutD family protein [Curtobacterium flaccumfaciens]